MSTPLMKLKFDPASDVNDDHVHADCMLLISQTLENLSKSGAVLALTPRQSSDASTTLVNHVELLCHVITLLQDNVKISALKLTESEQRSQHFSRKLESIPETLQSNKHTFLELQRQNELMAATIVSSKVKLEEVEQNCREQVRVDTRFQIFRLIGCAGFNDRK
jgi:hypothetical protein